jgi:hypothetical protein
VITWPYHGWTAALAAAAAAIATLTWFGLTLRGNPGSYLSAFRLGANRLA